MKSLKDIFYFSIVYSLFAIGSTSSLSSSWAAESYDCRNQYAVDSKNPFHYRPRGNLSNYCEGIYLGERNNYYLTLISFTRGISEKQAVFSPYLFVRWELGDLQKNTDVLLKINCIRQGLNYQLDTRQAGKTGLFKVKADIVKALNISLGELTAHAYGRFNLENRNPIIFLPISISQSPEVIVAGWYHVKFILGLEIEHAEYEIDSATTGEAVVTRRPFDRSSFMPGSILELKLPVSELPRPGLYFFVVTITYYDTALTDLKKSSYAFRFSHANNR